jgi:hypothetical protein
MLGQFGLLALAKGWEYKEHTVTQLLGRGQAAEIAVSEMGWILQVVLLTDDSYGTLGFHYQGSDLETHYAEINAELTYPYGAFMPDPSGYISRYFRPNPYSSAGIYIVVWNTSGYYGSGFAYVPTIKARIRLDPLSTQSQATVSAYVATVAITDKEAFLRSLRLALQSKADLGIDLGLLTVGPAELGKAEKKGAT